MNELKVIRESGDDGLVCYITDERTAKEKQGEAVLNYDPVEKDLEVNVLAEYAYFVEYGAKDTGSFTFTKGNNEDWFIAQVTIKPGMESS